MSIYSAIDFSVFKKGPRSSFGLPAVVDLTLEKQPLKEILSKLAYEPHEFFD